MDDYFSSFMRQTGVVIQSAAAPTESPSHESFFETDKGNAVAPIEIEEYQIVEPATGESAMDHVPQSFSESSSPLSPPAQRSPRRQNNAKTDPILPDLQQEIPAGSCSEPHIRTMEPPAPEPAEIHVRTDVPKDTGLSDPPVEKHHPFKVTVEKTLRKKEMLPTPPAIPSPSNRRPEIAPPAGRKTKGKALSHGGIQQNILKQVRRWVASQPALTTDAQRTRVTTKVAEAVEEKFRNAPPQSPTPPGVKQREAIGSEPEAAFQQLHLSIGPLNITMEPPRPEQPRPAPKPKQTAEPAPATSPGRLRRHHIRI